VDSIRVLAGDCTVRFDDGSDERRHRGHVVVLTKPDRTTLVHDATGYQPVA
jgi:DNA topoisomerase-1